MKAKERAIARRGKPLQPFAAPPLNWQDALWLPQTVSITPSFSPAHEDPVRPNGLYNLFSEVAGANADLKLKRKDV